MLFEHKEMQRVTINSRLILQEAILVIKSRYLYWERWTFTRVVWWNSILFHVFISIKGKTSNYKCYHQMIVEDGTFNNTLNLCVTRLPSITTSYVRNLKYWKISTYSRIYTHTYTMSMCDRFNLRKYPTQTNMLSILFALLDACQRRKDPQEICKPILKYYHRLPLL